MAYVDDVTSTEVIPLPTIEVENGRDVTHLAAFVALGLLLSVLSYALTPTELWPAGSAALASDTALAGLTVSEISIPAGLHAAAYPAH